MNIIVHKKFNREFSKLPKKSQFTILDYLNAIEKDVILPNSILKHLGNKYFEIRQKHYRVICKKVTPNFIVLLVFEKKRQSIPSRYLDTAKYRYQEIILELNNNS